MYYDGICIISQIFIMGWCSYIAYCSIFFSYRIKGKVSWSNKHSLPVSKISTKHILLVLLDNVWGMGLVYKTFAFSNSRAKAEGSEVSDLSYVDQLFKKIINVKPHSKVYKEFQMSI